MEVSFLKSPTFLRNREKLKHNAGETLADNSTRPSNTDRFIRAHSAPKFSGWQASFDRYQFYPEQWPDYFRAMKTWTLNKANRPRVFAVLNTLSEKQIQKAMRALHAEMGYKMEKKSEYIKSAERWLYNRHQEALDELQGYRPKDIMMPGRTDFENIYY